MKKRLAYLLVFGYNIFIHADSPDQSSIEQIFHLKTTPNHLYFGPEFLGIKLNTHVKNIHVNGQKFFSGFKIGYEYVKPNSFYGGIDIFSASREGDFSATLEDKHFSNNETVAFGNLETRFGYTFMPNRLMTTPFLGLGAYGLVHIYHYHKGYEEALVYGTGGVRFNYDYSKIFSLGFNLKIFGSITAQQRYKTEEKTYNQHPTIWGGEISVPFVLKLGQHKRWYVDLEPYFLKLDFSETQNIIGTQILFGYSF